MYTLIDKKLCDIVLYIKLLSYKQLIMSNKQVVLRNVSEIDVADIAFLHKKLFEDHLLGMMPVGLLKKFYNSFLYNENIFICAEIDNQIVGFVLGGLGGSIAKCKKDFLHKNFIHFGLNILIRPRALRMVLKTHFQKNTPPIDNQVVKKTARLRLLSIGVDNSYQGKGIAALIVKKFEETLLERDDLRKVLSDSSIENDSAFIQYGLSVHKTNIKAIRFYYKLGFMDEKETKNGLFLYKMISLKNKEL